MVWRIPALVISALGALLLLSSCAAAAPPATLTPVVEPSTAPPAAFADGDYLLTVDPICTTLMNGRILSVSDGTATLHLANLDMTGPVSVDGTSVSIKVAGGNGGFQVTLEGTVNDDGTVTGTGNDTAGPGSGYDCDFTFTLSLPADKDATLADGDYVMHVEPDCPTVMEGRIVTVAGGVATYLMESGFTMTGPATTKDAAVSIRLDLTDPSVITTTLDGTLYTSGTVVGSGRNGGIHPGGETGYDCEFTFIMTPAPPAPPAPTAAPGVDCSQAALQAAEEAAGVTDSTVSDSQFVCSGEWATAGITVHGGEAQVTGLFHLEDGTWVKKNRNDECAAGTIPADIATLACNSN